MKERVLEAVRAVLEDALQQALRGAQAASDEATHTESKAENKYDTRGLEASYLAAGQGQRALELRQAIASLQLHPCDRVTIGALVEVEPEAAYLIAPAAGGVRVEVDGRTITVLTPASPLGEALLGAVPGDEVSWRGQILEVVEVH